jgi:hypothetical protein
MSALLRVPALEAMAVLDGMATCALVDAQTGMVLDAAGAQEHATVAEAATDYWRMCHRQAPAFGSLGGLRVLVAIHERFRLTVLPCGAGLLLVCVSEEPDRVDWNRWRVLVGHLQQSAKRL